MRRGEGGLGTLEGNGKGVRVNKEGGREDGGRDKRVRESEEGGRECWEH